MADILKNVVLNCNFPNRPVNTFALGNSLLPPQLNPRPEGLRDQFQGLCDLVKGDPTPNPLLLISPITFRDWLAWPYAVPSSCCLLQLFGS